VISRESSKLRRVVTISKGSDEGIAEGDVVIAEGGALAAASSSSARTSRRSS
jgi:cell shape-determining protein MreC